MVLTSSPSAYFWSVDLQGLQVVWIVRRDVVAGRHPRVSTTIMLGLITLNPRNQMLLEYDVRRTIYKLYVNLRPFPV